MSTLYDDRFIKDRREVQWDGGLDMTAPEQDNAYVHAIRGALMPATSVLHGKRSISADIPHPPDVKTIKSLSKVDAPGVATVPGDRLCDWGASNNEAIMCITEDSDGLNSECVIYGRNMETKKTREVAAFPTVVSAKGIRWSPSCKTIGVVTCDGLTCVDAVKSEVVIRYGEPVAASGMEWRDEYTVSVCTTGGVAVWDIRVRGKKVLDFPTVGARLATWTSYGLAVATVDSELVLGSDGPPVHTVSTFDIRSSQHKTAATKYNHLITAMDWTPESLAVGTVDGAVYTHKLGASRFLW